MKTCGILIASKYSIRFPGKNRLLYKKNAEILIQACGVNNVYMFTDDKVIIKECKKIGIQIITRTMNANKNLQYIEMLKHVYLSLKKDYDIIVTVMCNAINHKYVAVKNGINKIKSDPEIKEVRSFDRYGNQSGIFIFRSDSIPDKWWHMAAILSNGKEIHYKEDL